MSFKAEFTPHAAITRIHSEKATAEILGLSVPTLRRLVAGGDGPKRIKLSARRIGYSDTAIAAWLETRGVA
jgi:predicted DNA-binding transcriptional regulator AlpA